MTTVLLVLAAWSLSGLIVALLLRRQGHNLLAQASLGLGFGPLVALFHLNSRHNVSLGVSVVDPGRAPDGDGWIDVLVGLDGSAGSLDSVSEAVSVLAAAVGRIRLAVVLDIETANRRDTFDTDERLVAHLREAAERLDVPHAELVLLAGRADLALVRHAIDESFDLLVVAHRHRPKEAMLLGSTVSRLARDAPVPVLIGPPVPAA